MSDEVSPEQRQHDYDDAEAHATTIAERFVEARASGWRTWMVDEASDAMDEALTRLRRAKRRLEDTQRRRAKKQG